MVKENSDIVECDVVRFNEDEEPMVSEVPLMVETFDTEEGLVSLIEEKHFHQHVWNKLYKSELVLPVLFEKGKLNEDEFWTYQIFGKAKRVSKINKPSYFYLQRSGSIMGATYNIRRLDALEAKAKRQEYMNKHYPDVSQTAKINFFGSCIFAYQSILKFMSGEDKKKAEAIVLKYVKKCRISKDELNSLSGKNRFWFKFAVINFNLCCRIRSVLGIGF